MVWERYGKDFPIVFRVFRSWCVVPVCNVNVNRRRKSYVRNMQNWTDLSIGVRQYGVGLFIFSLSTHLPGAALPPETGVVSALTLTAVPVSGCLWSRSKFPLRYPVVEEAFWFSEDNNYVNNITVRKIFEQVDEFLLFLPYPHTLNNILATMSLPSPDDDLCY